MHVFAEGAEMPELTVRLAQSQADLRMAQRLRYRVFVQELGGHGAGVDHDKQIEKDTFDEVCQHLLLIDDSRTDGEYVVGAYRLLDGGGMAKAGQFYTETEFDLTPLKRADLRLLEVGRTCLHRDYRGGPGMMMLWNALSHHVMARGIDVMFGVASFHGVDTQALQTPLSHLHALHLAPSELRPKAIGETSLRPNDFGPPWLDKKSGMRDVPALIKAYLRLGGWIGEGAFVDLNFNTTDICLVLDLNRMNPLQKKIYTKGFDR